MANPFLMLGGIAVGIITATFGVLQVPGWVATGQDSSAVNDLDSVRGLQAAVASASSTYTDDIDAGTALTGMKITFGDGKDPVHLAATKTAWCAVVLSASGRYLAAGSEHTEHGDGDSAITAAADAGCDPSVRPVEPHATWTVNCPSAQNVRPPVSGFTGTVRWSDETTQSISNGTPTAKAIAANTEYTVTVTGTFTTMSALGIGGAAVAGCFTSLDEWVGDTGTTSMAGAFANMSNLTYVPDNAPTGKVTTMQQAFVGATKFNSPINGWDVSKVENMEHMFSQAAKFDQPLNNWDTGEVTRMRRMFYYASAFSQDLSMWNVANVTDRDAFGVTGARAPVWVN